MRAVSIASALIVSLLALPAAAEPRPYRGPHPLDLEGHWHDESDVHVHDDLPVGLEPFGRIDGVLVFLADPDGYGWRGDTWTFRGAHPLPPRIGGLCGLSGDHRHPFAPEGDFRRDDQGVYRFVGALRGGEPMATPGRAAAPPSTGSSATAMGSPPPVAIGLPICSPDVPPGIACVSPVGDGVEVLEPRRRPAPAPRARVLPDRAQGRRHSAPPNGRTAHPDHRRRQRPAPIPWPI